MGKTQTYNEDLMLDAVVQYAETHPQKIMLTKLANWASEAVPGLEGIRDYHFKKPITTTDPTTRKKNKSPRPSYKKIQEINTSRATTATVNRNILLQAANLDSFFVLSRSVQIDEILKTRHTVQLLMKEKAEVERDRDYLTSENKRLKEELNGIQNSIDATIKTQSLLQKKIALLLRLVDETQRRHVLEKIGISNNGFDLEMYSESLNVQPWNAFSIDVAINKAEQDTIDIMKGLEF